MATRIQLRRGLSTGWAASNPTLALGEIGVETDSKNLKMGDGVTAWNSLAYLATGNMTVASGTLDNVNDGTAYKRIAAAVATALNAGTYDAASVSAFGIGDLATAKNNQDMDALTTPGLHNLTGTLTNGPTDATLNGRFGCIVLETDVNTFWQVLFSNNTTGTFPNIWMRNYDVASHVGWGSWYKFWNTWNDGNGGQPPAPKPKIAAGVGKVETLAAADGAALIAPSDGSQYVVLTHSFTTATGVPYGISLGFWGIGIFAASGQALPAVAGVTHVGAFVRIA